MAVHVTVALTVDSAVSPPTHPALTNHVLKPKIGKLIPIVIPTVSQLSQRVYRLKDNVK